MKEHTANQSIQGMLCASDAEKVKPIYKKHKDHDLRIKSAKDAIKAIIPIELYPAHKKELLSVCIWKITEADGKTKVRYWSEGAVNNIKSKLQHEHVHERRELIQRLLNGEEINSVAKDAIGCMVTQEEHKILTEQTSLGWQRYIDSNIKVFDSKLQQWCQ